MNRPSLALGALFLSLLLVFGLSASDGELAARAVRSWIADDPPGTVRHLRAAVAAADGCDRTWGLLVLHRGRLMVEAYYNGMDAEKPINLKSVTKSLNSAMVGVAGRPGVDRQRGRSGGALPSGRLRRAPGQGPGHRAASAHHVVRSAGGALRPLPAPAGLGGGAAGGAAAPRTLDGTGYGLLWWLLDFDGEPAFAALGHGGQELVVFPRRELVVLLTSRWRGPSSSEHYRHLQRVIREHLLPAFPA